MCVLPGFSPSLTLSGGEKEGEEEQEEGGSVTERGEV